MIRKLLYIIIIGLSFVMPLKRADVARLEPVEAVAINKSNNQVVIMTDTGGYGAGISAEKALADLHQNASSIIYLDTAKYLLVTENAVSEIEQLRDALNRSIKLCVWGEGEEMKEVVKYLSIHGNLPKLSDWKSGYKIPSYCSDDIKK